MLIFERLRERAIEKLVFIGPVEEKETGCKEYFNIRVKLVIPILKNFCAILDTIKKNNYSVMYCGGDLNSELFKSNQRFMP